MQVYEALADAFVAEGTQAVFGLMGDANMHWVNAMAARDVSFLSVRHEGAGLAMADGFGRASGQPGVCTTTSGPGTTQLATTMVVASRARTPLVAFCGDLPEWELLGSQAMDQRRFAAAIEADYVRVTGAGDPRDAVREAFYRARAHSRPVLLSAPLDVQMAEAAEPSGAEYVRSTTMLDRRPLYPHPDAVREAAAMIADSARIVVVAGRGAMAADAGPAIARLAEATGALVATTVLAKGFLSDDPYLAGVAGGYSPRAIRELYAQADCVVAVGASFNAHTTQDATMFGRARLVHVDVAAHRPATAAMAADCYVRGDARLTLEQITERLAGQERTDPGFRTPEVASVLKEAYADPQEFALDPGTVDPRKIAPLLDERLPSDVGIVYGSGHHIRFTLAQMRKPRPYAIPQHHFGCIGQGPMVAIGACVATDRKPVCVIEGDTGVMMHLADFDTAVRYNLPVLVVVMNDEALGAEYHKSAPQGLDPELSRVASPDLGAVGVALGGRGAIARSVSEVEAALDEWAADPGPYLLDVRTSRTVISIPYRRRWHGADV